MNVQSNKAGLTAQESKPSGQPTDAKAKIKADILHQIGNKPGGDLKAADKKPGETVGSNLQSPLPGPSHEQLGGSGQFDKKFQSHRTGQFDKKIQSESPQQSREKKKEHHFNVPARAGQFQNR